MKEPIDDAYVNMLIEHQCPHCWLCGRVTKPTWWYSRFSIERAHIVNKPRRKDRRAVVLLCSLCHCLSHGDLFPQLGRVPDIKKAHLLWLKERFDSEYYDREFLQANHVGLLPDAEEPPSFYRDRYNHEVPMRLRN